MGLQRGWARLVPSVEDMGAFMLVGGVLERSRPRWYRAGMREDTFRKRHPTKRDVLVQATIYSYTCAGAERAFRKAVAELGTEKEQDMNGKLQSAEAELAVVRAELEGAGITAEGGSVLEGLRVLLRRGAGRAGEQHEALTGRFGERLTKLETASGAGQQEVSELAVLVDELGHKVDGKLEALEAAVHDIELDVQKCASSARVAALEDRIGRLERDTASLPSMMAVQQVLDRVNDLNNRTASYPNTVQAVGKLERVLAELAAEIRGRIVQLPEPAPIGGPLRSGASTRAGLRALIAELGKDRVQVNVAKAYTLASQILAELEP